MKLHARAARHLKINRLAVLVAAAVPLLAQAQAQLVQEVAEGAETGIQQVQVRAQRQLNSYTVGAAGTATPLDLSLRETPQSVSVVTLQRIEDQRLQSVTDVVNNTTGVSVNQYETNRAQFTSRGFEIDNLQIDGLPTTYEQQWSGGEVATSLAIYDRVEVVRGATGLMTGAGNPSAAINLVRKHADSKQVTGWVEAGAGSWNERRVMGDVSTPLNASGTVRARVVGEYTDADSWVDQGGLRSNTVYATVSADLTPRTLLSAGYSRQESRAQSPMWGSLPYWYSDGTPTNWDVSKTTAASWNRWPTTYANAFIDLQHTFENGWKVRAVYDKAKRDGDAYLLYLSGRPDRVTGEGMSAYPADYINHTDQEDIGLHASGAFALGGRQHEAAFGYMRMKQDFNADNRPSDIFPGVGDFNNWNPSAFPQPNWGAREFYQSRHTRQEALYGVARFALADPLKLIVGARVSDYERSGSGGFVPDYAIKNDHEVTPYAGLVYDIDKTYSAYASYTSIFQPQNTLDLAGKVLDPIKGKNVEAGVKGEFLDGRLNGSLAVFQVKQDNLAQAAGRIDRGGPLGPETYYVGSEGAKSEGFEFELAGELARGWSASAGYTQFRIKDAAGADINSIYPRRLLRAFTTYRLPGAWDKLSVGGGVNWEGKTYTIVPDAPPNTDGGRVEQESFALVNLMARYEFSKQLSAQLNVNNVFDKKHFGLSAAYEGVNYQAPRGASLTLRYRF
jgi:outer membrane receptor for ferric coprogen and ferric-rhodotorulic acid